MDGTALTLRLLNRHGLPDVLMVFQHLLDDHADQFLQADVDRLL